MPQHHDPWPPLFPLTLRALGGSYDEVTYQNRRYRALERICRSKRPLQVHPVSTGSSARALLGLDRATQITAAHQIAAKKMSVREAESLVKKLSTEFSLKLQKSNKEELHDTRRVEEELADLLMAQVEVRIKKQVKRNGKREDMGEVAIQFGSMDELNGLIERLRGGK